MRTIDSKPVVGWIGSALLGLLLSFPLSAAPQIVGFGPSVRYVGVHGTYSFHVTAYGNRLRMVDANGNLMALDDSCCGDE